jgi:hypothetical protein
MAKYRWILLRFHMISLRKVGREAEEEEEEIMD